MLSDGRSYPEPAADPSSIGRSFAFGSWIFYFALAFAAFAAGLAYGRAIDPLFAAIAFLPLVLAVFAGVRFPETGIFARVVHRGLSGRAEVALTFDDGPDPRWTPGILDLLEQHGQRATFFLIGERAACHPELVREIHRRGHEIGNHTWSHSYRTPLKSPAWIVAELERTRALLEPISGEQLVWFRPPVGLVSPRVAAAAERAGVEIVCWSGTARDGTDRVSMDESVQRLERALEPGAILVLHDTRIDLASTPSAGGILSRLLPLMQARGLRSVTLSELFARRR
ncbi:MAG: polysaccharide deacetylase family protein [Gemmatimonas sp.]